MLTENVIQEIQEELELVRTGKKGKSKKQSKSPNKQNKQEKERKFDEKDRGSNEDVVEEDSLESFQKKQKYHFLEYVTQNHVNNLMELFSYGI